MRRLYVLFCLWAINNWLSTSAEILTVYVDEGWTATNANKSINVPVTVPGDIYTDLQKSGILGDPYYRFNDVNYRWVAYDNWTYSTRIEVSNELLAKGEVYLVANGLDTVATVYLNQQFIDNAENMFIRYKWPVKQYLKIGNNTITIDFTSPVTYALSRSENYTAEYSYVVPPECPSTVQHGECHPNFIRKIQSSFSWDWGPAFPTVGIWQPLVLEGLDTCLIRDISTYTSLNVDDNWDLSVAAYFECSGSAENASLTITVTSPTQWESTYQVQLGPGNEFINITATLPADAGVEPWWPNNYGSPTLYNIIVKYSSEDESETSTVTQRIGFRTVELVQEEIEGAEGLTFYFKVNGVPIFMKGSNWIPADSFPSKITQAYMRNLLQSAVDAHFNGLRVWGGGQYEQDAFYDIADELGILIWQDMMYACALYPTDSHFLSSVEEEINQQIRRLQHHPSILLWSGNNENEAALADNWYGTKDNSTLYYNDYRTLYADTIMPVILLRDTSRPFVMSSPSNGIESVEEGYISSNPSNPLYGDVHYYQYTEDAWNWNIYPRPRFTSEYGIQSWPSFETLSKVSESEDWDWTSAFMEHRQHHEFGNAEMVLGIVRHLKLPVGCQSAMQARWSPSQSHQNIISVGHGNAFRMCDVDGYKGMLYLSQIYQAMGIKTESEYYRRAQTEIIDSKGNTMGALYWQINDIWQGASWASIEYGGKWKMLHYYAKNFFSPVLISPFISSSNTTVVYSISDIATTYSLAYLHVDIYRWNSFSPASSITINVTLSAQKSVPIYEASIADQLAAANCTLEECFFYYTANNVNDGSVIGAPNFIFTVPFFKAVGLQKANITVQTVQSTDYRVITIVINSTAIAPFVWLEAEGISGRFSDNGFLMITSSYTVEFYAWEDVTTDALTQNLKIISLMDIY